MPTAKKSLAEPLKTLAAPHLWLHRDRQFLSASQDALILAPLAADSTIAQQIMAARQGLFAAEKLNTSEGRAAGHWALRCSGLTSDHHASLRSSLPSQFSPDGQDLIPRMHAVHEATRVLAHRIRSGEIGAASGRTFRHVIHLGIGGSDVGPHLIIDALSPDQIRGSESITAHFLSNLDYHGVERMLSPLDPQETLVIVASKSFSTLETLTNAMHCRQWLQAAGVSNWADHFVAVTSNPQAATEWGIAAQRVLWFDESIGGRFSLWGPVSLVARVALGNTAIDELLVGGCKMDAHFLHAPLTENLPAVLAAQDFYNLRTRNHPTLMISAYDSRLGLLVPYLKQLWMESLGKQVDVHGKPIDGHACPILWGDVGTNAQHAFFQLLHQGTQGVAVELIGIRHAEHAQEASHRALLANLLAQAQALSAGRDHAQAEHICLGGHPVNLMFLDSLSPRALGALIALWEHRVLCLASFTGVNPFDQWGVEAGKTIARSVDQALATRDVSPDTALDETTQRMISWLKGQ